MGAMVRVLCVAALLALALSAETRNAFADDEIAKPSSADAREHLTAGTRLYRLREFEKAIEQYKAGALKEDAPVFYYNLGQCYRQLGKYEDAIWSYQRFLDRAPSAPRKYREAADGFIHDMKAELEKKAMTRQPTEPAPDGQTSTVGVTKQASTEEPQIVQVIEPGEPWYSDGFGWGLSGVGLVGSTVSIYLLLDAKSLEDDANQEPSQETQNALRDRASQRRLAGVIVGVVGVGALITGVVKLAITSNPRERTVTAIDFGLTHNGFVVMGRF